ncbi:MAG: translation initiation factor [Microbacteriaceae bacterium]|nr:translation initiation factor [Microbacteriaceae bacterium]
MRIEDAIRLAQEADLDLVEVAPNSKPPVAKIMDFGKFKYETAQKAKEAKRNQSNTILKEVRFRLKIDVHDYETKRKRAEGFLKTGDKVKAMILFRGREQSRPEQGVRLLQRFAEDVAEFGTVESTPMIDGRNMVMVIGPLKTKAEVKAETDSKKVTKPPRAEREVVESTPMVAPIRSEPAPAETKAPVKESVESAPAVQAAPAAAPKVAAQAAPEAAPKAAPQAAPAAAAPEAAPKVAASKAPAAAAKAAPAAKSAPAAKEAPAPETPAAKTPAARETPAQPAPATPASATPASASAAKPGPKPGMAPKPRAAAPKTAPADVTTD